MTGAGSPSRGEVRHGVARVISKRGHGSRKQATEWVRAGRVKVNGVLVRDADFPTYQNKDIIEVDGAVLGAAAALILMLNKPRGLVTTASDEKGRDTVYSCLAGADLPWVAPVGRLDKASEGLLLFTNDPVLASWITDPATGPDKTYHVQVKGQVSDEALHLLAVGLAVDGELLSFKRVQRLRHGEKNTWLEVVLDEGRNRQIRRLLQACDLETLRLIRVSIGSLELGTLGKGHWRMLTSTESSLFRRQS